LWPRPPGGPPPEWNAGTVDEPPRRHCEAAGPRAEVAWVNGIVEGLASCGRVQVTNPQRHRREFGAYYPGWYAGRTNSTFHLKVHSGAGAAGRVKRNRTRAARILLTGPAFLSEEVSYAGGDRPDGPVWSRTISNVPFGNRCTARITNVFVSPGGWRRTLTGWGSGSNQRFFPRPAGFSPRFVWRWAVDPGAPRPRVLKKKKGARTRFVRAALPEL